MFPGGVAVPPSATFSKEAGGGLVVVAEGVGDDGGRHLQELLPDGSAAGGGRWNADLVEELGEMVGAAGLARSAAGEQPARGTVDGGVHNVASRNVVQQQGRDRLGDGRGRFPQAQEHVFSVAEQIIDRELDDPGKGYRVEEHDDAGDPQALGKGSQQS
ncbi:hypothetical protein [Nonomuraea guangzhouensis]|uniref:Uncharacterized protein n=1 Tax=Nonomuraea guangzhouensis TaxID=1291555 RepID=A0ABW4GRH9_9ACTN|nr:hypothetical protein [Nonomuraea guangzhouensis]